MKLITISLLLCFIFIPTCFLNAEKVAVFEEFGRPGGLAIAHGLVYIQERTSVFIYNLKDFKFLKSFGKEGEGPGEIKMSPFGAPLSVIPFKNKLYITSLGKLSIYTKTGEYLKEYKVNQFDTYYPIGKKYLLMSSAPMDEDSNKLVLALFLVDENFENKKIIYKTDFQTGANVKMDFPITPFYPDMDKEKMFIIVGRFGFAIDAFDLEGKKLYRISKKFKPIKVPQSYRKKTMDWFKKDPNFRQYWNFFKDRITFKDEFPPIYRMNADNGRLYIFTSKMKDDLRECIVMDHRGKEIKRVFLFLPERYGMDFYDIFTITNNYFYRLIENVDDENWELHRTKIE